jgi:hypothetical protein
MIYTLDYCCYSKRICDEAEIDRMNDSPLSK